MAYQAFMRIQQEARHLLPAMVELLIKLDLHINDKGEPKTRGWFCAFLRSSTHGRVPTDTFWKFPLNGATEDMRSFDFCEEKARRVLDHKLVSSFQMRDEAADKYGGGIPVCPGLAIAVSGFPELSDEALVLYFGTAARLLDDPAIHRILAVSKNERYGKLLFA